MNKIYLSPPEIRPEDSTAMQAVMDTGWIAPVGPELDAFEKDLSELIGCSNACAVNSGTSALHLALLALGVEVGDRVICPSLTFAGCAFPILYCGAKPVFIDSEIETWNMDPAHLEVAIKESIDVGIKPKAVIVVHIYGQCAKIERIADICKQYGISLIEDVAEALGASFNGKPAGSFGDLAFFSFNGNKIITTSGGGMLLSDSNKLVEKARYLAHQAREPAIHYEHKFVGYNYRLSNVLAALGRSQLNDLDRRIKCRKNHYQTYTKALASLNGVSFMPIYSLGEPNYWLTCLTIDPDLAKRNRDQIIKLCEAELIEVRPTWKPLHLQPVFKSANYVGKNVAEDLYINGLCLPSGSNLSESSRDRVIAVLRNALQ